MGARPAASYARGLIWTGKRAKKKPPHFCRGHEEADGPVLISGLDSHSRGNSKIARHLWFFRLRTPKRISLRIPSIAVKPDGIRTRDPQWLRRFAPSGTVF